MASGTGPEESYWQQLIKSGLYLAHWQKEKDHDFSQPLVFIGGPSRDRTVDLLITNQDPLINNNLPQHPTIKESESYSDSPVAAYCGKLPLVT